MCLFFFFFFQAEDGIRDRSPSRGLGDVYKRQGIYYLTQLRPGSKGEGMFFKSVNEAILAYENGYITLHSQIKVRVAKTLPNGEEMTGIIDATLGRLLFNEIIPQDLGFVDREVEGNELKMEIDFHVGKKQLKQILEKVINTHGATATAEVLDDVKAIGYKFSTCLLYTSDAADEEDSVDLGGRRIL